MMNARERILKELLQKSMTQTELRTKVKISRSRLSEILSDLRKKRIIKKRKLSERTIIIELNDKKVMKVGILKASEYAAVFLTASDLKSMIVDVQVYNNSLEELRDLIVGKIDLCFAPIISGFLFHVIDDRVVVLSGCARGGSGIVFTKEYGVIGSTPFSTMDLKSRVYSGFKVNNLKYFNSPEELIERFEAKDVDAIAIWEPYFSSLKTRHKVKLGEDTICCGMMSLKESLARSTIRKFIGKYIENTELLKNGKREIESADLMQRKFKFKKRQILKSLKNYKFTSKLNEEEIKTEISIFGFTLPEYKIKSYLHLLNQNVEKKKH